MHPATDEFGFTSANEFSDVSVGRKNDYNFTETLYVQQIEELRKVIIGEKLINVLQTVKNNWSGEDANKFWDEFIEKLSVVVDQKQKENIAKFTEGIVTNNALFKSEQNKVEL